MQQPAAPPPAVSSPAVTVLEARALEKRFGTRRALADVGLTIGRGELVAVIGPNGAGKTTLLSILAGIVDADGGIVERHVERIGWVPQRPGLYARLTVRENLETFARLERLHEVARRVDAALSACDLVERAHDRVDELSGGLRQRTNLAVGLLGDPELLLLDEPTTALDPRQRENFWSILTRLAAAGTAILYTTHLVQEAERYADRVLVLADGELVFAGSPDALAAAVGAQGLDFEEAFVRFLRTKGH
ncbi:putative ABC transporter ATP-binding protein YbhF [bacterium HR41]|nr:putative ABC transporter ATP-binding protein YbhF [bacterium HR41]